MNVEWRHIVVGEATYLTWLDESTGGCVLPTSTTTSAPELQTTDLLHHFQPPPPPPPAGGAFHLRGAAPSATRVLSAAHTRRCCSGLVGVL